MAVAMPGPGLGSGVFSVAGLLNASFVPDDEKLSDNTLEHISRDAPTLYRAICVNTSQPRSV
jgi:hypothetical protein